MKRFLINAIFFSLIVILVLGVALFLIPNRKIPDNSLFASYDKHQRLSSLKSPKIILVGGSNLPFGIKSQEIEAALGMPVVDMGLHAGLGLNFILSEVEKDVYEGDVVVVSPEYHHFLSQSMFNGEDVLVALLFDVNRDCIQYVKPSQWMALLPNICLYSSKKIISFPTKTGDSFEDLFTRDSFNSYGDEVAHYGLPSTVRSGQKVALSNSIYDKALRRLVRFRDYVEEQGAKFILVACPYPKGQYNLDKEVIEKIANEASSVGLDFLIEPKDCLFPDSLMFNSFFHLSGEGGGIRTAQLINVLQSECLLPQK